MKKDQDHSRGFRSTLWIPFPEGKPFLSRQKSQQVWQYDNFRRAWLILNWTSSTLYPACSEKRQFKCLEYTNICVESNLKRFKASKDLAAGFSGGWDRQKWHENPEIFRFPEGEAEQLQQICYSCRNKTQAGRVRGWFWWYQPWPHYHGWFFEYGGAWGFMISESSFTHREVLEKPLRPRGAPGASLRIYLYSYLYWYDSLWGHKRIDFGHQHVSILAISCVSDRGTAALGLINAGNLALQGCRAQGWPCWGSCCSWLCPSAPFKSSWWDPKVPHTLPGVAKGQFRTSQRVQSRLVRNFQPQKDGVGWRTTTLTQCWCKITLSLLLVWQLRTAALLSYTLFPGKSSKLFM